MTIEEVLEKVRESIPTATQEAVEETLKRFSRTPAQVGNNHIKAIVSRLQSSALVKTEGGQISSSFPGEELEIATAPLELTVPDFKTKTKVSAEERLKSELATIHMSLDEQESARARALVNEVVPAFLEQRLAQSPNRVANHVGRYMGEVTADLQPKFQQYFGGVDSELCGAASSVVSEFFSDL